MANDYLKAPHAESEYTPHLIQELARCRKDPVYFMQNYVYVQHPKLGKVIFDLYDYQIEMVDNIHNNRHSIVLASRQVGKCLSHKTLINRSIKPTGLKKILLKFLDRNLYGKLFE